MTRERREDTVQVVSDFYAHPKLLRAGVLAGWLWACGIGWCNHWRTDGWLLQSALPSLARFDGVLLAGPIAPLPVNVDQLVDALLAAGLWEREPCPGCQMRLIEHGSRTPAEPAFYVHDFLEYNLSRAEVERDAQWVRNGAHPGAHGRRTHAQSAQGTALAPTSLVPPDSYPSKETERENGEVTHLGGPEPSAEVGPVRTDAHDPAHWDAHDPGMRTGSQTPVASDLAREQAFRLFWATYPRKKDKDRARRAWAELPLTPELLSEILAAIDRQKTSDQWRRGFVPHPSTWLNNKRWEDEEDEVDTVKARARLSPRLRATAEAIERFAEQP